MNREMFLVEIPHFVQTIAEKINENQNHLLKKMKKMIQLKEKKRLPFCDYNYIL